MTENSITADLIIWPLSYHSSIKKIQLNCILNGKVESDLRPFCHTYKLKVKIPLTENRWLIGLH